MSLEGLSGLVNRIIAWADRLQREHGVLGFPYAVMKKYGDDAGGRQAALITYYGFALLYLIGQALVYAAEVAAVRYARLWPRALDLNRPTAADARALTLLAREQERISAARIQFHLAAHGSPPANDAPP